jgi:hypothetical protein
VTYSSRHDLLLVSVERPSWVVAFRRNGDLAWATPVGWECCNFACFELGNRLVHAASCGKAVTILDGNGCVLGLKTDFPWFLSPAPVRCLDSVVAVSAQFIHVLDSAARCRNVIDVEHSIGRLTANGNAVYMLSWRYGRRCWLLAVRDLERLS